MTTTGPTQAQYDAAAQHLLDDIARLDQLPARDHAREALGPDATDTQIRDWLAVWRPEALERDTA